MTREMYTQGIDVCHPSVYIERMETTAPRPRETGREETVMVSTFSAICPCCDETVTATDAGFAAVTVSVGACSAKRAAGFVSFTVRKTDGYAMAAPMAGTISHRDGLVSFGA